MRTGGKKTHVVDLHFSSPQDLFVCNHKSVSFLSRFKQRVQGRAARRREERRQEEVGGGQEGQEEEAGEERGNVGGGGGEMPVIMEDASQS